MKWLFIIAALLNIAFGVYNLYLVDDSMAGNAETTVIDKTQIVLLDELNNNTAEQTQQNIASEQSEEVQSEEVVQTDENEVAAATVETDEPAAAPEQLVESAISSVPEVTEVEKEADIQAEPELNSESVEALADNTETETPADTDMLPVDEVSTEQEEEPPVLEATIAPRKAEALCYKTGPFSKDVMNELRLQLETEYQNQLSFGIETTSAITYYRIYIPPLKDKTAIKTTLQNLDDNDLNDHYVMSIGGRKNAIALGVFKKRKAAESVAKRAAKIGLSTTIEAISDDKNSLYQLMVIFQNNQNTDRFMAIISEKKLQSEKCDK